jgi:signal transduction histidine kinase
VLSLLALVVWRLYRVGCRRTRQESSDEQMAAIGKLAAGIAHEIRNPLNTISLTCRYIERILAKTELEAPLRDDVNRNFEVISSEVGRLTRTLDSFLLLAPPESMQLTGTDLDNVVDEALTLFRRDLDMHHVELERGRAGPIRVSADPERLCQVFANIVRNAIEAMPDGGRLSVATGVEADRARVTFTDTGCGIGPQNLPRVFEPYFTTKRSGLGIGLALSLKTMAAHGGTIEASSQAGRGARFTVVLPTEASHG